MQHLVGENDFVCAQCLGVALGGVEKAPVLGGVLTPESFEIEVIRGRIHVS